MTWSVDYLSNGRNTNTPVVNSLAIRVSVQGVESLGGHFARSCHFDFCEVKEILLFFKKKMEILLHFQSLL